MKCMVGEPKIGGREKGKSENLHLRFQQQQQTSSLVCISNMCLTMFPLKSGSDETESSLRLRGREQRDHSYSPQLRKLSVIVQF